MSNDPLNIPEMELTEIAHDIFSKPAGPPRSICLDFDEKVLDTTDRLIKDPVFNIYGTIAYIGIQVLFGQDKHFSTLTMSEMNLMQKYMNSMGVKIILTSDDDGRRSFYLTFM